MRKSTAAALLAAVVTVSSQPAAAQDAMTHVGASRFAEGPCPFETDEADRGNVLCGSVDVPENWDSPALRRIRVPVAVFRARAAGPGAEAYVWIGGGPTPTLAGAASARMSPLRNDRDLIVFDYRGTGSGDVVCPDIGRAYLQTFATPVVADALRESRARIAAACRSHARDSGVDLGAYNARNMALDVIAIVTVLGYESWTIDAVSFGTAVAQHVMRLDPRGLRAVVLRGPLALDAERIESNAFARALDLMAEYCAQEPACAAEFPDPVGAYDALYDQLEREPLRINVARTENFPEGELFLTGTALKRIVTDMLYARSGLAAMPMLVREIGRGNTAPVALIANRLAADADRLSGTNWAAQCDVLGAWAMAPAGAVGTPAAGSDATPAAAAGEKPARADYFRSELQARCDHLGVPPAPPDARAPVRSNVPTLIVVGEHDPVTPPEFAHAVARMLTRASILVLPGRGHEFPGSCTMPLVLSFLADPADDVDGSCFAQLPPVPFAGTGT